MTSNRNIHNTRSSLSGFEALFFLHSFLVESERNRSKRFMRERETKLMLPTVIFNRICIYIPVFILFSLFIYLRSLICIVYSV